VSYFNEIYNDPELSARAKQVLVYLHDRANKDGESWYAINTMAKDLSLSRSTIKRGVGRGRIGVRGRARIEPAAGIDKLVFPVGIPGGQTAAQTAAKNQDQVPSHIQVGFLPQN